MAVELHLPDLPEVPVAIGGGEPAAPKDIGARPRVTLRQRLRDLFSAYLPLVLMALLALGSWWLVKNMPPPLKPKQAAPPRAEPDYTMSGFTLERFEPSGRLKVRLSGAQLRHFPDTDRIEVDQLRLEAFAPDGRIMQARAQRGLSNGDASEIQLFGQVQVQQQDKQGAPLRVSSEFLHLYTVSEQMRTHLPVRVERGGTVLTAQALSYDHAAGLLAVGGPARVLFPPRGAADVARKESP